jgi:hypothetical protein
MKIETSFELPNFDIYSRSRFLNFDNLEFYREINKFQQEYDEQTSHDTSAIIQEFWNRKIDAELKLAHWQYGFVAFPFKVFIDIGLR